MSTSRRRRELPRADRVLPGLWRLRLPLPWAGVPHVNAYAVAWGSGVVLVDCGLAGPGTLDELSAALEQTGAGLEHVRLLVCTHAHADHYGQAAAVVREAGCELWMHPDHGHVTRTAADPEASLQRRLEIGRQSGVPARLLASYEEARRGQGVGVGEVRLPDRELRRGAHVETDLGRWHVHETPGHAPSHVVLHQPERDLLLSGDHLLGRISLYYDYGYTPDPVGEFLASLERVDTLDARLCLSGHGRPFRDVRAHVEGNRRRVAERLELVRRALADGPRTAYECVPALIDDEEPSEMLLNRSMTEALCYLTHLERTGRVRRKGGAEPERWEAIG